MGIQDASMQPKITAVALTTADTEYTHTFREGTRAFSIKCREANAIRYAWVTGKVATPTGDYRTLPANATYSKENVRLIANQRTIYLAGDAGSETAEVEEWL